MVKRVKRICTKEFKEKMIKAYESDKSNKYITDTGSTEKNELIRLKEENLQLKKENDILKQAAFILRRK